MWGCIKAPLGSSLVPKAFLWGHFWMGEKGSLRISWGLIFQSSSMPARAMFRDARKQQPGGSSCMWGCVKAPLGSSLVPKAFLWGHFCMVQRGLQRVFWCPVFQSSPMPATDIFRVAWKNPTRRVQLHVGLRKGSPGEFSCTQSLPLGALLDGRKGLTTRFLWPNFSVVFDAG